MTEADILTTLDNSSDGLYQQFIPLGHPYSYLIDSRINVFHSKQKHWALAAEKLGYNPRTNEITREIYYYGNCLVNLESYNGNPVNCSQTKVHQANTPNSVDELRRLVFADRGQFRATDEELYNCIPLELKKLLVIDEWFHKDYTLVHVPLMSDDHLRTTYEFNKNLTGLGGLSFEDFRKSFTQQMMMSNKFNQQQWQNNRPGTYETWHLIAKAISLGDPREYKPTLTPNSHWSNWPDSGSL